MDLLSLIIIIAIIAKVIKKGKEKENTQKNATKNTWNSTNRQSYSNQNYSRQNSSTQNTQWQQAARENIAKAKKRAEAKLREVEKALEVEDEPKVTYEMPKRNVRTTPAREQVEPGRKDISNTTILQRAKANTAEGKVDVTLQTMEAEHNHSERVAPATHYHPEDEMTENMLGTVEDLMVKGYDGHLCFERDFVGEGMDMISRFTLGGI